MNTFPIGIVLYNPSTTSIDRILFFANCGFRFYIFDNSQISNESLKNINNINYFFLNKNYGLSFSINFLCKKAIEENFNNLLFFDQDTIFNLETLEYIQNCIHYINFSKHCFFEDTLAINFREKQIDNTGLNVIEKYKIDIYDIQTVYYTINSGTLFFLNKFNSFQWFENKYFVDGVDYSFSLNSIIHGYKITSISNIPGLNHTEEQGEWNVHLFGNKITSRIYPLKRNYDFVKSHLLILFKSFKLKSSKPKLFIIKALFGYIFVQFIFRIENLIHYNFNKR